MKGRFIGQNLRKLIDMLQYVEQEDISALLISVDFYKCFDMVEFCAIEGSLKFFGFGQRFIDMVILLYRNFETAICHNGELTQWIKLTRGIHQGCAMSGFIFLLNAEILSLNLRNNPYIKGIKIEGEQELLSQFVDDMMIAIENDSESLQQIINELTDFEKNTGLTTNFEKTTIYRIGALKHSTQKIVTLKKFRWANENITILGIELDKIDADQKYQEILQKITATTKDVETKRFIIKRKGYHY